VTTVDVSLAVLYDRLVDELGAQTAAETMTAVKGYWAEHRTCTLQHVEIVADGPEVRAVFVHEPTCPALREEAS
jgi:hypothetical protein